MSEESFTAGITAINEVLATETAFRARYSRHAISATGEHADGLVDLLGT